MNTTKIHDRASETAVKGKSSRLWKIHASDCAELGVHRLARLGMHDGCGF